MCVKRGGGRSCGGGMVGGVRLGWEGGVCPGSPTPFRLLQFCLLSVPNSSFAY